MAFAVTPVGVRANIPIFTLHYWESNIYADLHWTLGDGRRVFLHLEHDPYREARTSHRPLYIVGQPRLVWQGMYPGMVPSTDGSPSWKEVFIRHRPPLHRAPGELPASTMFEFTPAIPMQLSFDAPVRFPEARIRQFMIQSNSRNFKIHGAGLDSPWRADSSVPTAYVFLGALRTTIVVGQCQQEGPLGEQRQPKALWATCTVSANRLWFEGKIGKLTRHDCSEDHVLQWPDLRKTFGSATMPMMVTLSFTPCPLNPERTLILEASIHHCWDQAGSSVQTYLPEWIIVI
ncbi:hypothetical protein OH76DRAFT_280953 [Lentinus brumalis]|uniref:Uncharacterized protein n=1 Tax=Lentinus brumalis TaxID=2498619 RepID=A0A371CKS1_9APHY|nr:hypothetical protein OH76DRAFT_280953 [Polyporus brumalis]